MDKKWLETCISAGELLYGEFPMDAIGAVLGGMYPTGDLEEGTDIPEDRIASIPTLDGLNAMMPMVNDFLNHVNVRIRKGWPPAELAKKMPKHQGMNEHTSQRASELTTEQA